MSHKFIFIGGLHRSGTSLVHELLSSHPEISGFSKTDVPENEGQHLQTVFKPASTYGGPGYFCLNKNSYMDETDPLATVSNAQKLYNEWKIHWDEKKTYLMEKSPPNLVRTRFLQSIFTESYYIIVLRHPIAIAYATRKWTPKTSVANLIDNALSCFEQFNKDMPYLQNVHIIHYEDFVRQPQKSLDKITTWLGLESIPVNQVVHSNINQKYFDLYKKESSRFFQNPFKSLKWIPKRYEKRLNKFGYSTVDLNILKPFYRDKTLQIQKNIKLFLKPYDHVNIYIPQLNLIYISISKTGISSIRSVFLKKVGASYNNKNYKSIHGKVQDVFQYIPLKKISEKQNTFKFTIVRNPFERLVSCYKNKVLDEDYMPIQKGYDSLFYKGMPFEEFAKGVCQLPDLLSDRHFRSQYSYLFYKGDLIVDFLGKLENIEKDFAIIKKKYDLGELPHINPSKVKKSYKNYYTPELLKMVYKRYKNDVENLNYQKEYQELKKYVENLKDPI